MLHLPDVTLVAVDCVAHQLTRLALEDTLSILQPRHVLIFSDRFEVAPSFGARFIICQPQSLEEVANILWNEAPARVETSHMLFVQWDGWPINADAWTDDFLQYDYVGAPWPWHQDRRVGNGGFSLRSVKLMNAAQGFYPIHPEDETLCRKHRNWLEHHGFRWAPEDLAWRFSVEHGPMIKLPFGFHDVRNWPRVLSREAIEQRVALANDYARSKIGFNAVENWLKEAA